MLFLVVFDHYMSLNVPRKFQKVVIEQNIFFVLLVQNCR